MRDERWGFTTDLADLAAVRAWVQAAIADGWSVQPTYKHESQDRAATLEREGFKVMALAREMPDNPKWRGEANIHVWGPDGLAITPPNAYDSTTFAKLEAGLRSCGECGADDVATQRVGFAGRSCSDCLPAARKKYEYPGWTS